MARAMMVAKGDRILRNSDLDVITGISRTTRWRLERGGEFPARRQISHGSVGWSASEVEAWMQARGFATGRLIGRHAPKADAAMSDAA